MPSRVVFVSSCSEVFQASVSLRAIDADGAATTASVRVLSSCVNFVVKELEAGVAIGMAVLAGVGLLLTVCSFFLIVKFRSTPILNMAQPHFLVTLLIGCVLLYSGIIAWGMAGVHRCYTSMSLFSVGFTFVLMSFYVKTFRVDSIFNKFKKKAVDTRQLDAIFALGVGVDIIFNIIWILVDPMVLVVITESSSWGYQQCTSSSGNFSFVIICLAFKAMYLLINVREAVLVRNVNSAFNEFGVIGFCVYNFTFFVCVLFPIE